MKRKKLHSFFYLKNIQRKIDFHILFPSNIDSEKKNFQNIFVQTYKKEKTQFWIPNLSHQLQNSFLKKKGFLFQLFFKKYLKFKKEKNWENFVFLFKNVEENFNYGSMCFYEELFFLYMFLIQRVQLSQKKTNKFLFLFQSVNFSKKSLGIQNLKSAKCLKKEIQKSNSQKKTNFLLSKHFLKIFQKRVSLFFCAFISKKQQITMLPFSSLLQSNDFQKICILLQHCFFSCVEIRNIQKKHSSLKTLFSQKSYIPIVNKIAIKSIQIFNAQNQGYSIPNFDSLVNVFQVNKVFFSSHNFLKPQQNVVFQKIFSFSKTIQKQRFITYFEFFLNFYDHFYSKKIWLDASFQTKTNQNICNKNIRTVPESFIKSFFLSGKLFQDFRLRTCQKFFSFFPTFFFENFHYQSFKNEYNSIKHFLNNSFLFQYSSQIFVKKGFLKEQNQLLNSSFLYRYISNIQSNLKLWKTQNFFQNFQKKICFFFHQINKKRRSIWILNFKNADTSFFKRTKSKKFFFKDENFLKQQKSNSHFVLFKKKNWLIPTSSKFFSLFLQTIEIFTVSNFVNIEFFFRFLQFFWQQKKKKTENQILSEKFYVLNIQKKVSKKVFGFQFLSLFVFLNFQFEKSLKKIFFFKTKPTRESIYCHLNDCKKIVQNSVANTQFNMMKKLQKKIDLWCLQYDTKLPTQKVFSYCEGILFKFLWNWAKRKHPNKNKNWIRKKYFHFTPQKKWFFGKKIQNQFVCVQLHSTQKANIFVHKKS